MFRPVRLLCCCAFRPALWPLSRRLEELREWMNLPARRRVLCRPRLEALEERLPPTVNLSISNPTPFPKPDSGQILGMFAVTRSGDPGPAVQVSFATQDGTGANGAHAGTDYVATSGTLSFAANQTTATIAVPIIGNNVFQADKTFTVGLSHPRS